MTEDVEKRNEIPLQEHGEEREEMEFSGGYTKKLGLVWEKQEEFASEMLKKYIPFFRELPEKEIFHAMVSLEDCPENPKNTFHFGSKRNEGEKTPLHFLLEGENLHSLDLLLRTHSGKVDIIYIDPPYNTGNKDFFYDDDFVAKEDQFRHSKWLSFMERRLMMAKQLLSTQGILFVSIGEQEQAPLTMLLHEIFGEHHFLMMLPRITTKSGKSSDVFSKNHDYVLMYTRRHRDMLVMEEYKDAHYTLADEHLELRGNYRVNQTLDYNSLSYSTALDYPIDLEGRTFYPGGDEEAYFARQRGEHARTDWAWRWSEELFRFGLEQGFIVVWEKQDGSARIYTKTYEKAKIVFNKKLNSYEIVYVEGKTKAFSSLSLIENEYSNTNGKKDLKKFSLEQSFDYPKPVALMKKLFRCHEKKNALILDFFAGTGTTGQAVLELNQEDGGTRRFILCTDNQNGICQEVTYPRLAQLLGEYAYEEQVREELFRASLSIGLLNDRKKLDSVLRKCELEKKRHQEGFETISKVVEEDCLVLVGKKTVSVTGGLSGHLKYYQLEYVTHVPQEMEEESEESEELEEFMGNNPETSEYQEEMEEESPPILNVLDLEDTMEEINIGAVFAEKVQAEAKIGKKGKNSKSAKKEKKNLSTLVEPILSDTPFQRKNKLMRSVKELIQLEFGVDLNGREEEVTYVICITEEELDQFLGDEQAVSSCKGLYLGDSVLLLGKQRRLLGKYQVPVWRIPTCYFKEEERGVF